VASTVYIAFFRNRNLPANEVAMTAAPITDTALIAMAQPITIAETKSTARVATPALGVVPAETTDELMEADAAYKIVEEDKGEVVAILEAAEEEVVSEEVVVEAMPMMEKAAEYEKKERAAAAKTMEVSAVAAPSQGAGMPDRQAAPVGGIGEFNRWIQSNIRYPEDVVPRVRQVVVVTFKVAADSTIYDLKVAQTAGEPFTKEAFRLLRVGPRWEPAMRADKRVEEEVKISIVFK
jgi:outer membrane biosynthesis protein TonB